MNMGYFQANSGAGYSPHDKNLGYFSTDTGAGYGSVRSASENDLFDTSDI